MGVRLSTADQGPPVTSIVERPTTPPPGAVLVRVPVVDGSWVAQLPPVPAGSSVTVTVTDERLRRVPADDLVSSGYRIAGVAGRGSPDGLDHVFVLVTRELQDGEPTWFRRLLAAGDRALPCDLGPVQRVHATSLRLHVEARLPRLA